MCVVTGKMEIKMVAHVYRQEIYAGQRLNESIYDESPMAGGPLTQADQVNVSPVNFIAPKLQLFPHLKQEMIESYEISQGDCIFIPAYYFYQYTLINNLDAERQPRYNMRLPKKMKPKKKQMATAVNLQFQSNSKLLQGYWDAVEKNIIK